MEAEATSAQWQKVTTIMSSSNRFYIKSRLGGRAGAARPCYQSFIGLVGGAALRTAE